MNEPFFTELQSEDRDPELDSQIILHSAATDDDSNTSLQFACVKRSNIKSSHMDKLSNERYRMKCKKIKREIRSLVFENAALCDEVAQLQEKIMIAKEERKFFLRKLLNFQQKDGTLQSSPRASPGTSANALCAVNSGMEGVSTKPKKKIPLKRKTPKDIIEDSLKAKTKRKKTISDKRVVQPIPLDSSGRPVFPLVLGELTIHSLGEIVSDKPGYHTEEYIFPIGFCSSRTYVSTKQPSQRCLYTCTIMDGETGPKFEIVAEDDPEHPIISDTANDCYNSLIKAVNSSCGREVLNVEGRGAEFFGFSHPTIQNLIQSCHGARKCTSYRWVRFEVSKTSPPSENIMDEDPAVNFNAFSRMLLGSTPEDPVQEVTVKIEPPDEPCSQLQNLLMADDEMDINQT